MCVLIKLLYEMHGATVKIKHSFRLRGCLAVRVLLGRTTFLLPIKMYFYTNSGKRV